MHRSVSKDRAMLFSTQKKEWRGGNFRDVRLLLRREALLVDLVEVDGALRHLLENLFDPSRTRTVRPG